MMAMEIITPSSGELSGKEGALKTGGGVSTVDYLGLAQPNDPLMDVTIQRLKRNVAQITGFTPQDVHESKGQVSIFLTDVAIYPSCQADGTPNGAPYSDLQAARDDLGSTDLCCLHTVQAPPPIKKENLDAPGDGVTQAVGADDNEMVTAAYNRCLALTGTTLQQADWRNGRIGIAGCTQYNCMCNVNWVMESSFDTSWTKNVFCRLTPKGSQYRQKEYDEPGAYMG